LVKEDELCESVALNEIGKDAIAAMNPVAEREFVVNVSGTTGPWENYRLVSFPMMWRRPTIVQLRTSPGHFKSGEGGGSKVKNEKSRLWKN